MFVRRETWVFESGNVTSIAESYPGGLNNRTVTNTYDAINRLEVEQVSGSPSVSSSYAYDSANNRTGLVVTGGPSAGSATYTYNSLNQLTGYGNGARTVSLIYDADGNRGGRIITGGTDEGFDSYSYDFENRLVQVQGNHGASGTRTYSYGYDYRTRRVLRNESQAGGASTQVVFSGGLSVEEYASGSGTGTPTVEYVRGTDYGGGVGGVLYTLRGGAPSYTHENRRGDVVAKTDASGNLTYQAQYQAFGSQVATTGTTQDRQQANTKDEDPTGLLNEGMRYYDLDSGEFMTKDPAGFVDGPNLYTYVNQNPWTKFDPEGLAGIVFFGLYFGSEDVRGGDPLRREEPGDADSAYTLVFGSKYGKERINQLHDDPAGFTRGLLTGKMDNQASKAGSEVRTNLAAELEVAGILSGGEGGPAMGEPMLMPAGEGAAIAAPIEAAPPGAAAPVVLNQSSASGGSPSGKTAEDDQVQSEDEAQATGGDESSQSNEKTPAENKKARQNFKNNKAAARAQWEDREGKDWPTDEYGNPWPAHHDPPLKSGGDPMHVEPQDPKGPDPHNIPGPDGKTDYQKWGAQGAAARQSNQE